MKCKSFRCLSLQFAQGNIRHQEVWFSRTPCHVDKTVLSRLLGSYQKLGETATSHKSRRSPECDTGKPARVTGTRILVTACRLGGSSHLWKVHPFYTLQVYALQCIEFSFIWTDTSWLTLFMESVLYVVLLTCRIDLHDYRLTEDSNLESLSPPLSLFNLVLIILIFFLHFHAYLHTHSLFLYTNNLLGIYLSLFFFNLHMDWVCHTFLQFLPSIVCACLAFLFMSGFKQNWHPFFSFFWVCFCNHEMMLSHVNCSYLI